MLDVASETSGCVYSVRRNVNLGQNECVGHRNRAAVSSEIYLRPKMCLCDSVGAAFRNRRLLSLKWFIQWARFSRWIILEGRPSRKTHLPHFLVCTKDIKDQALHLCVYDSHVGVWYMISFLSEGCWTNCLVHFLLWARHARPGPSGMNFTPMNRCWQISLLHL